MLKKISLSEDIRNKLIYDFVNSKLSISQLSRNYNIGRPRIRKILEESNVYEKRFIINWTKDMDEILISIYDEYHNIDDIVEIMGISKDSIKRRAKKLGLTKKYKVSWLTPDIKYQLSNWNGENSISSMAKEIGINQETLREYLKKIGKDTYSYRKMNPNYTQQYQIKGKLENDLKNPTIPAWQISNEFGMSETWIHKKRKDIFSGNMILMRNTRKTLSKAEFEIANILDELDIIYYSNYEVEGWSIDFYLGKKMIIEVQGDYWHSSEKKKDIDERKKLDLQNKGYFILYIKENEIEKDINKVKTNIIKFWVSHISNNM